MLKVKPWSKRRTQIIDFSEIDGNISMTLKLREEAVEGQANQGVKEYLANEIFGVA